MRILLVVVVPLPVPMPIFVFLMLYDFVKIFLNFIRFSSDLFNILMEFIQTTHTKQTNQPKQHITTEKQFKSEDANA